MKKKSLSKITKKYIGVKYKLGGNSIREGFDCFTLIRSFLKDIGIKIPDIFEEYKKEDYLEIYKRDDWKEIYLRYLKSLGREIDINYILPKDILIINTEEGISVGIYTGNGKAMVLTKYEVEVFPLKVFEIIGVIRCPL